MGNKRGDEHYVDRKEFEDHLKKYYETDVMTNELGKIIENIAKGLSRNHRFIRYTPLWKDEMIGDAVLKMYMAMEKKLFKFEYEINPFSYFNMIAWHAFENRIKKENNSHKALNEYKELIYTENMSGPESQGHVYVKPLIDGDDDCGYED
jgi:hypothetical protein